MKRHRWLVMGGLFALLVILVYVQFRTLKSFDWSTLTHTFDSIRWSRLVLATLLTYGAYIYPRVSLERIFASHQAGYSRADGASTIHWIYFCRNLRSAGRIRPAVPGRTAAASDLHVAAGGVRCRTRVRFAGRRRHHRGHAFYQPLGAKSSVSRAVSPRRIHRHRCGAGVGANRRSYPLFRAKDCRSCQPLVWPDFKKARPRGP